MFRTPIAFMLTLLAAAPAYAETVGRGDCQPHRNGEVRCALTARLETTGTRTIYEISVHATRVGAEARMMAEAYASYCGHPGRMLRRSNIANSGTSYVGSFNGENTWIQTPTLIIFGVCVEVFLQNCTAAGQPVPCANVVQMGVSQIELRVHTRPAAAPPR